jgi:polysaccharide deacetylase 2 family uncharacterized protein YibQ
MGFAQLSSRMPLPIIAWMTACLLLTIGVLSAALTVLDTPQAELERARDAGQHITIDPLTGVVSGLAKSPEASPENRAAIEAAEPVAAATNTQAALPEAAAPEHRGEPAEPNPTEPVQEGKAEPAHTTDAPSATPAATQPAAHDVAAASQLLPNPDDAPKLVTTPAITEVPAVARSNESTVVPPAKEITEEKNGLMLPKIGDGGVSPSSLYAKNFTAKPEMAKLSIVITDAGYTPQSMTLLLKLPRSVTIALSPYVPEAAKNIALLRAAGFETWGMLPMMGERYPSNDPGPLGLIASLPPEELSRRLETTMATTIGSVGFVLPFDEALSDNAKVFPPTLNAIAGRGLRILSTHPTRTAAKLAGSNKALLASIKRADVVIDANASAAEIQSKLDGLQTLIMTKPSLILALPARPNILALLTEWLNVNGQGSMTQIAPLSAMYKTDAPPKEAEKGSGHGTAKKIDLEKASGPKPAYNQDPKKIDELQH